MSEDENIALVHSIVFLKDSIFILSEITEVNSFLEKNVATFIFL